MVHLTELWQSYQDNKLSASNFISEVKKGAKGKRDAAGGEKEKERMQKFVNWSIEKMSSSRAEDIEIRQLDRLAKELKNVHAIESSQINALYNRIKNLRESHLICLPAGVIDNIASYLTPAETAALSKVSKLFHENEFRLQTTDPQKASEVLTLLCYHGDNETFEIILNNVPSLWPIRIEANSGIIQKRLEAIGKKFPHLTLSIKKICNCDEVELFLKICPNTERLLFPEITKQTAVSWSRIKACFWPGLFSKFSKLTKLQELDLSGIDISKEAFAQFSHKLPLQNLQTLKLGDTRLNDSTLKKVLEAAPNLKALQVATDFISSEAFQEFHFPKGLKTVDLKNPPVDFINILFKNCPGIEEFRLDVSPRFNALQVINFPPGLKRLDASFLEGLQHIFSQCPKLEELSCGFSYLNFDETISFPSTLQKLDLNHCSGINGKIVANIFSQCQMLRVINLSSANPREEILRFSTDDFADVALPRSLQEIYLRGLDGSAKFLHNLLTRCPELSALDISGCTKISSQEFLQLRFPPSLRNFYCLGTSIDKDGLTNLFSRVPDLQNLGINECTKITLDAALARLFPTGLRQCISYHVEITADGLRSLFSRCSMLEKVDIMCSERALEEIIGDTRLPSTLKLLVVYHLSNAAVQVLKAKYPSLRLVFA